jgi:S1-C subfamily serine protease
MAVSNFDRPSHEAAVVPDERTNAFGPDANAGGSEDTPKFSHHQSRWRRRLALLTAAAVVLAGIGLGIGLTRGSSSPSPPIGPAATGASTTAGLTQLRQTAAAAVAPNPSTAPVNATVVGEIASPGLTIINTTLSFQGERAAGTGMVLTPDGLVLTNNHVIEGETSIRVTAVGNGVTYQAQVLGYDRSHDVALLQLIGASGLRTVTLANSTRVDVGTSIVGVGNANGVGHTTSAAGSVTALNQSITASDSGAGTSEQLAGLIETNAGIVPGDSGGSLVDASGHVVGMDTAGSASFNLRGGRTATRAYAIPINQAVTVAEQIAAGQSSPTVHIGPTAFLGIAVATGNGSSLSGATIAGVVAGGPAATAGLTAGDTIVSFDGHTISTPTQLTQQLLTVHPGTNAPVQYLQGGLQKSTTVTLSSGPPQ